MMQKMVAATTAGQVRPAHPDEGLGLDDTPYDHERLDDPDKVLVPDDPPGPVQPGDWRVPFLD